MRVGVENLVRALLDGRVLRPEQIELENLDRYTENVSGYVRQVLGLIRPGTRSEVIAVVKEANRCAVPLYPFSRGANWAFGSKIPVKEGCVLLDLSALNRIVKHDPALGYVVIEPGVSQGQLAEFLEREGSPYFVDVTGSGALTSVIGNALERGIAYNSLRADRIRDLEVVLGTGEVVRSGFPSVFGGHEMARLYRYGIGPCLDQLFFQSGFGIVLSASYLLHPKPEKRVSLQIEFQESDVPEVLETFRKCLQNGILDCIPHAADPFRSVSTLAPLLPPDVAGRFAARAFARKKWSAIASVHGSRRLCRARAAELKRAFRGVAKVTAYDEKKLSFATAVLKALGRKDQVQFIEATAGLRGLVQGRATSDALGMAYFREPESVRSQGSLPGRPWDEKIDSSPNGVLFCVPLAPFSGEAGKAMVELVRKRDQRELKFGITLNMLDEKVLEAVISIHFKREHAPVAHDALRSLYAELIELGFYPYRLNPGIMDLLKSSDPTYADLLGKVKKIFDPNGIIAPGRYEIPIRAE